MQSTFSRRELLAGTAGLALAAAAKASATEAGRTAHPFPKEFLWGVATAGHQVEGNNVNSDTWLLEHVKPTAFIEPSGDACDHYHLYEQDIALVAKLGFNAYRFSLEWARIEPEPGEFSNAELAHYRRVLETCHHHGLKPVLTFNHFTTPRWFAARGAWEHGESPQLFARFCERATRQLGDLIGVAGTLNEPNLGLLFRWFGFPAELVELQRQSLASAARAAGSERFSTLLFGDADRMLPNLLEAHRLAKQAIKAGPGEFPVGVSLAIMDDQASGDASARNRKRAQCYEPWLEVAKDDDYVGVQTYGRARIGSNGAIPPDAGAELTQTGEEFYPEGLEHTVRSAAAATAKPVYVTENGIATSDDTRRVEYIRRALLGIARCLADGVDVRGYVHWSLLDNFEWVFGYAKTFGLVAVDRATQQRTAKPSASYLGAIARRNAL